MKNKQMTAVEWLQERINIGLTYEQEVLFEGLFEQAKEMEKEREKQLIIGTYIDLKMNKKLEYGMEYLRVLDEVEKKAEKYYNEIMKNKIIIGNLSL
jgi:hypothetical protein